MTKTGPDGGEGPVRGEGGRTAGGLAFKAGEQGGGGEGPASVLPRVEWIVWSAESPTPGARRKVRGCRPLSFTLQVIAEKLAVKGRREAMTGTGR